MIASSTYNVSLVAYDPYTKSSEIVSILGLTNTGSFNYTAYHMNGVDYDRFSQDIYLTASSAEAFNGLYTGNYSNSNYSGPNRILKFDPRKEEIVSDIDLVHAQDAYFKKIGHRTSGFQDIAETSAGDAYSIGTFGNSIVKIPAGSARASLWYAPEHYNETYGFGGIFSFGEMLVVSDTLSRGLVTFDTFQTVGHPQKVQILNQQANSTPLTADGLFAPTKYGGKVALWSGDYNGTFVYWTADGWQSAHYLGLVSNNAEAVNEGGLAVATFEMGSRLFALDNYFQATLPVKDRKNFPVFDITDEVEKLVANSQMRSGNK